mgnify:CR=1 FL=1
MPHCQEVFRDAHKRHISRQGNIHYFHDEDAFNNKTGFKIKWLPVFRANQQELVRDDYEHYSSSVDIKVNYVAQELERLIRAPLKTIWLSVYST